VTTPERVDRRLREWMDSAGAVDPGPQSNKLLLEAGIAYYNQPYEQDCRASVKPTDLPILNGSTGPA